MQSFLVLMHVTVTQRGKERSAEPLEQTVARLCPIWVSLQAVVLANGFDEVPYRFNGLS